MSEPGGKKNMQEGIKYKRDKEAGCQKASNKGKCFEAAARVKTMSQIIKNLDFKILFIFFITRLNAKTHSSTKGKQNTLNLY